MADESEKRAEIWKELRTKVGLKIFMWVIGIMLAGATAYIGSHANSYIKLEDKVNATDKGLAVLQSQGTLIQESLHRIEGKLP